MIYKAMQLVGVLGLLLSGLCFVHAKVSVKLNAEEISALEHFVNNVMMCRDVKGLSLTLVKGQDTIYARGFGYRDIKTKAPLTETTLLNIGSESKAFTSTLAADAVARKLITWDEPLKNIFPAGFRLQDNFRSEKASLRDFLSHRLGMPSYWGVTTSVMNLTLMEISQRLKDFPVLYDFRNRFLYSNYLFVAAGAAVENATGESWSAGVYNRIFKPLNMTGSRVSSTLTDADWSNMAYSNTIINGTHVQNPEKEMLPIVNEIEPAAGIFTNAVDMAKWMKFHISGGKDATGHQVIPRSILEATHTASMATDEVGITRGTFPVDNLLVAYGLGWFKGVYNGYAMTCHDGAYSSYTASLTFLPDAKIGVWVGITGSRNGEAENVRNVITMFSLDLLLGEVPWLNTTTACTYPAPWTQTIKSQPYFTDFPTSSDGGDFEVNANEYVGDYVHPAFGTFHVIQVGDQLKYKFGLLLTGNLYPKSRDQFYQTLDFPLTYRMAEFPEYPRGFPILFTRNNQGEVASVKIPYLEFSEPPVFTK